MAGKELINKIRKKGICGTIKMIAVKWKKTERDLWNPPIEFGEERSYRSDFKKRLFQDCYL